jgi:hypothetical protein
MQASGGKELDIVLRDATGQRQKIFFRGGAFALRSNMGNLLTQTPQFLSFLLGKYEETIERFLHTLPRWCVAPKGGLD